MDIHQLKQFKILVIGDSCKDIYHYGVCDRLSPEAPVPVFIENNVDTRPGMSSNVYSNLSSIGVNVRHITNKETIEKHRYIDSRFKQHLMRVDIGDDKIQKPFNIDEIQDIENYSAVIISDYNKGFLTRRCCSYICKRFKKLNIPVFVDSKKKNLSCFSDCYIKINEKEFTNSQGFAKNCKTIITLGSRGATYNNKVYTTDKVDVFDVCGAGDVFLSILVSFFLLTNDIERAILYANRCASYSVTKMGTYIITLQDLKFLLKGELS
tara:strand:- start:7180 stop:7977 length:798 start_codon:yes stop_codon:yes gene_type:complete